MITCSTRLPILPGMPVTFIQQETITTIRLCNSFVVCVPMRGALPGIASLWAGLEARPTHLPLPGSVGVRVETSPGVVAQFGDVQAR